jgi:hypothetical protein
MKVSDAPLSTSCAMCYARAGVLTTAKDLAKRCSEGIGLFKFLSLCVVVPVLPCPAHAGDGVSCTFLLFSFKCLLRLRYNSIIIKCGPKNKPRDNALTASAPQQLTFGVGAR